MLKETDQINAAQETFDIISVSKKSQEIKTKLEAEIKLLKKDLRLVPEGQEDEEIKPIESREALDIFMKEAVARLNQASLAAKDLENPHHRKNTQQSQELLNGLVRSQDRFLIDMKTAQVYQMQFVIEIYEQIAEESDATKIPQHTALLRSDLKQVDEMPALDNFELRTAEISKMASLFTLTASMAKPVKSADDTLGSEVEVESVAAKVIAAGISQAFRESAQSFNSFIEKERAPSQIMAPSNPKMLEEIVQEVNFVNSMSRSFQESFIVAGAIRDGKVIAGDNTADVILGVAQTAISQIPLPVIQQGAGALITVAKWANAAKKDVTNRNVADFATSSSDEPTDAEKDLRQEIVLDIARKVHGIYSQKTEDTSPLDKLTEKGQAKFAGALAEQVITQISKFELPKQDEIPRLDDEKFKSDAVYRGEMSQKYSVKIDESRLNLGGETYQKDVASQIETKMYVDFISDRLISSVIQGRQAGLVSSKVTELATKVRFNDQDVVNPKENKNLTLQGFVNRTGIITADGQLLGHEERLKDGENAKYGFRAATSEEEKALSEGKAISGYVNLGKSVAKEQKEAAAQSDVAQNSTPAKQDQIKPEAPQVDPDQTIAKVTQVAREQILKYSQNVQGTQEERKTQINRDQDSLRSKQEAAKKLLEANSKPKPFFKRALTFITGGLYSGGKKPDVTEDKKRLDKLTSSIDRNDIRLKTIDKSLKSVSGLVEVFDEAAKAPQKRSSFSFQSIKNMAFGITDLLETAGIVSKATREKIQTEEKTAAQKSSFTNLIAKSFDEGFVLAEAVKGGKVKQKDDGADIAIGAMQSAVGLIPLPLIQQGAGLLLTAGQYANQIKKHVANRNVADFANDDDKKMRQELAQNVAEKLYQIYSYKTDGKSPLDNLNEKGMGKFAGALVEQVFSQVRDGFQLPTPEQVPQGKTYLDFVADKLISSTLQSKSAGVSEVGTKIRFEDQDLAESVQGKKFTIQGMISRVGLALEDGKLFASQNRQDTKYGFRGMTSDEKQSLAQAQGKIAGYVEVDPAQEIFAQRKQAVIDLVNTKIFANGADSKEEALKALLESYKTAKEKNPKLDETKFLKDSPLVITGESKVFSRTDERKNFNAVKDVLVDLLKATTRVSLDEIRGVKKDQETTSFKAQTIIFKAAESVDDPFAKIDAAPKRSKEDLVKLAPHQQKQERDHVSEKLQGGKKTDLVSVANASAIDLANTASSMTDDLVEAVMIVSRGKSSPAIAIEVDQVLKNATASKMERYNDNKDNLCAVIQGNPAHLKNPNISANNALIDFAEGYHAKVMEGASREDLRKFAADNLPVKTDNKQLMQGVVGLAVEYSEAKISQAESRKLIGEGTKPLVAQNVQAIDDRTPEAQPLSSKQDLLINIKAMAKEMGVAFKGDLIGIGGEVKGSSIKMPGLPGEVEKEKPYYLVFVTDKAGAITDVELHGGDNKKGLKGITGSDKRELFEKDGTIKESHRETVQKLLQHYGKELGIRSEKSVDNSALGSSNKFVDRVHGHESEGAARQ